MNRTKVSSIVQEWIVIARSWMLSHKVELSSHERVSFQNTEWCLQSKLILLYSFRQLWLLRIAK